MALPRLLVLGGGRGTGKLLVERALAAGARVTAFAPHVGGLAGHPALTAVPGSVLDAAALAGVLARQDVVVSTVGTGGSRRPTTLYSIAGDTLLPAMRAAGVQRLIVVTGVGAGDSRGHGGFLYDRIVFPLFTRGSYEDKTRLEERVAASELEWTIVRPATLTNGTARGRYRVVTDLAGVTLRSISRADVAEFLWSEVTAPRHSRRIVNLTD